MAFYDGVAERIRRLLKGPSVSMPIAKLARRTGCNRSSLSNFLHRKTRSVQAHLLVRIAKGLDVSAAYLMTGGDPPNRDNSPADNG